MGALGPIDYCAVVVNDEGQLGEELRGNLGEERKRKKKERSPIYYMLLLLTSFYIYQGRMCSAIVC